MPRRPYPSDLSDAQWARLAPLLPGAKPGGRPRAHPLREVVDALRYVLRGGIAWRALPHEYPPWQTVSHYFRAWRLDGTWERISDALRETVRERAGRNRQPSAGILDSQSVRTTERGGLAATTGPRS
jgi:transposase